MSDGDVFLLTPQEKKKGELKGSMEKSETDRLQERRQKKAGQRAKRKHQEKKAAAMEKAGLKNKYTKEKVIKDLKKQEGKDVTFIEVRIRTKQALIGVRIDMIPNSDFNMEK